LLDRLKTLMGSPAPKAALGDGRGFAGREPLPEPFQRQSNGLDQFFGAIRDRSALNLLDFAGATQENVSYITSMGHRLSSEDFVRGLEVTFGGKNLIEGQSDPRLVDQFIQDNLAFPPDAFDGALVWDGLQFLSPHLLQIAVDRLHDTLRPGAYMLAFFYADDKARQVPTYQYRIVDHHTLALAPRGYQTPGQFFNNRAIEKLFQRFASVKFFLAKDYLREIIVRR
jgi:hypothetical protein